MVLAPGEVDQGGPEVVGRDAAEIDLQALGDEHAALGRPADQDLLDVPQRRKRRRHRGAVGLVVELDDQIEVAARLPPPPQRPGRLGRRDAGDTPHGLQQRLGDRPDLPDPPPLAGPAAQGDGVLHLVDLLGPDPFHAVEFAGVDGPRQVVDRLDPPLVPELLDGLRPEPRQVEHPDQPGRHARGQLVVVRAPPGVEVVGDDRGRRLADPLLLRQELGPALDVDGFHVDVAVLEQAGDFREADCLERRLALEVEDLRGDLEQPRQLALLAHGPAYSVAGPEPSSTARGVYGPPPTSTSSNTSG